MVSARIKFLLNSFLLACPVPHYKGAPHNIHCTPLPFLQSADYTVLQSPLQQSFLSSSFTPFLRGLCTLTFPGLFAWQVCGCRSGTNLGLKFSNFQSFTYFCVVFLFLFFMPSPAKILCIVSVDMYIFFLSRQNKLPCHRKNFSHLCPL